MSDFLLEIGLEEVPARMIATAEAELGRRVHDLLTRERLLDEGANVKTYSTPRRLAVLVEGVRAAQADVEEKVTGPSWKVAFKDDTPTPAAEAFAKKAGVAVDALEKVTTPKGEYVGATVKRAGKTAGEILTADLSKEVLALYWAKNMYWRANKPERFVRPVRWIVAMMDAAVVPLEIAGIKAVNASRGHRILHGDAPVVIGSAREYAETLRGASVLVDVAERRQVIRKALDKVTRSVAGARWREDEGLVETVTHLTEWPSVILGDFEPEYLALPEEVLVTVMRDHQKYFAVEDAQGKLAPHFLAVLNTTADDEGQAIIRHGNARVLRARFKDARFFWDFDQKIPLAERVESLKNVTFQKELGSYHWKTEENLDTANALAKYAYNAGLVCDNKALLTAVKLSKTDLTTELVKEFTELQGIIGGLYARAQGLGEHVALAIYEQYTPASTEDNIPVSVEGQLLGLTDRIQTIAAMFGIGLQPTGSKDPFALRRAANAIVKILAESSLPLTLSEVAHSAMADDENERAVLAFLRERLHFYLKDVRGFAYDVVNATLAADADDVRDAIARAEALTAARASADFEAVSAAFKRINNILRQAAEKGFAVGSPGAVTLSPEAAKLHDAATALAPEVAKLRHQRAYGEALGKIATLRPVVDAFFDKVMVLDPDAAVRGAHLGLIDGVLRGFSGIADFSEIVTG
ncbi:glycine--tRNA ligase subunit beta [Telmatobacter sp. DSM 110680]|uniref:Glycine--tRNA ligase beta subunit n=1 Tax=Telmatobacter sp. DSM 110680 TaxID=3036704 RepID=A0AAU7DG12_9BACT